MLSTQILYMLDDPGVDNDDNKMLHESILLRPRLPMNRSMV
jgi:hypothetical protein